RPPPATRASPPRGSSTWERTPCAARGCPFGDVADRSRLRPGQPLAAQGVRSHVEDPLGGDALVAGGGLDAAVDADGRLGRDELGDDGPDEDDERFTPGRQRAGA